MTILTITMEVEVDTEEQKLAVLSEVEDAVRYNGYLVSIDYSERAEEDAE